MRAGLDPARPLDDGYELATYEERLGSDMIGVMIYVKMSQRSLDNDADWNTLREARSALLEGLEATTVMLDPETEVKKKAMRDRFMGMFLDAGLGPIFMEELPNGYCPNSCCLHRPWFKVMTRLGHIEIGDRKRVTSIDWKDTLIEKSGRELFPDENVTKLETGIHAWTDEKVVEYLKVLAANGGG